MLYSCFWMWFHLLLVCISNQSLDPEEDALNKPWRPIPSHLISVATACTLHWILLPSCLFLSAHLGTHWHSISLALASVVYNELHFNLHGLMRNVCNAWAYASFNAGVALIAAGASYYFFRPTWTHTTRITPFVIGQSTPTMRTAISVTINTLIILLTIHSQDFHDQTGDKQAGQWTIPMVWPEGSQILILVILVAWSVGLSWACSLAYLFSIPFCTLAVFIGLRFFWKRTADEDRQSF